MVGIDSWVPADGVEAKFHQVGGRDRVIDPAGR